MYLGEIVEIGPADRVFRAPNHPYTESLLAAVLSLNQPKTHRRSGLGGPVPSPIDRPAGCPFHPRCPRKVGPACEQEPPWQEPSPGHRYRCVIAPATLREMQAFDRVHHRGQS
jgi:peptide/nickel transport system ATP-binding protein